MTASIAVRHRVAIAGRVIDANSGKPLRARVEIVAGPPEYEARLSAAGDSRTVGEPSGHDARATRTRPDGLFFFLDLPAGEYTLVAFVPRGDLYRNARTDEQKGSSASLGDKRYGSERFAVTVAPTDGAFDRLTVIRLKPTGITGRVVASTNQAAVLMAEIRVKGSGERTFTNASGEYTLVGIEPNARRQRTVQVRARGYREQMLEVLIDEPGACKKLDDVRLVREKSK
jgi:hypothetical protein